MKRRVLVLLISGFFCLPLINAAIQSHSHQPSRILGLREFEYADSGQLRRLVNPTGYCNAGAALPTAGVRVLLLYAEQGPSAARDVQSRLQSTGSFTIVDHFEVSSGVPSLSNLLAYTAVLAWNNNATLNATIGDVLAQYWDAGGAVVIAYSATCCFSLQGRFGTAANGYMLIDGSGNWEGPSDSLGRVVDSQSPLMTDVAAINATHAYKSQGAVINGGTVVAYWTSGRPLIVKGTRASRPLVALNIYPPSATVRSDYWTGNGTELLRNALLYSTCAPCGAGTFAATGADAVVVLLVNSQYASCIDIRITL